MLLKQNDSGTFKFNAKLREAIKLYKKDVEMSTER